MPSCAPEATTAILFPSCPFKHVSTLSALKSGSAWKRRQDASCKWTRQFLMTLLLARRLFSLMVFLCNAGKMAPRGQYTSPALQLQTNQLSFKRLQKKLGKREGVNGKAMSSVFTPE